MSQGIGQYIRSIASDIEGRVTSEMRKVANEQILPILGSEYAKLRHGMHPSYEYDHDQGGKCHGSVLLVILLIRCIDSIRLYVGIGSFRGPKTGGDQEMDGQT